MSMNFYIEILSLAQYPGQGKIKEEIRGYNDVLAATRGCAGFIPCPFRYYIFSFSFYSSNFLIRVGLI